MEFEGKTLLDTFAKVFDRPIGPYDRLGNKKSTYAKPSSYGKPRNYGGKPSTYGKPRSTRSKYPKTSSSGKDKYGNNRYGPKTISDDGEAENPHTNPQAIARGRVRAVSLAKTVVRRHTVRQGAGEKGIIVYYDLRDGQVYDLPPSQSGGQRVDRRSGTSVATQWRFDAEAVIRDPNKIMMCTAHTHPKARRPSGRHPISTYQNIDDANTIEEAGSGESNLNSADTGLLVWGPVIIRSPDGTAVAVWGNWRGR